VLRLETGRAWRSDRQAGSAQAIGDLARARCLEFAVEKVCEVEGRKIIAQPDTEE
jgi:hypothetical protein